MTSKFDKFRSLDEDEGIRYSNGTSLQGYIDISYTQLVNKLGEGSGHDDYKSDAGWTILFGNGTVATIYNYKDGINYCGESGTPKESIRDWHIGGKDRTALKAVSALFPRNVVQQ